MSAFTFVPPFRQLVDGVRAYLEAHAAELGGRPPVVERGWKARGKQINQGPGRANRVVFSGSKPGGDAGRILKPRQAGQRVLKDENDDPTATIRSLGDWSRVVYVSVWAYDGDRANDEGAQDDAAYLLFLWTMRAVNATAFGNAEWGGVTMSVPLERSFGLEILSDLTFQHQMPDVPDDYVFPVAEVNTPPMI